MTTQFEMFPVTEARARATDPETSHAAAASISTDKLRASQAAVLKVFRTFGPCPLNDLVDRYDELSAVLCLPRQSESGIRTRCHELVVMGSVKDSDTRVALPSGRKAIVWEAV